ncbi:MAG TPA: PAS domain-containing sensor histidine kinase [Kofleriaceae bacterium]|nr:PAS domain-containing sensor histidine kinase [Kofleriaceae bacterium]
MSSSLSATELRLLVEHSPVMIWRAGLDAKCDYFNPTWLDYTGRTLEQEQGDGWAEGVHPEDLQRCVELYLDHFHRRQPFEMEYRLRRHDGVYRWIFDRGVPYHDDDGVFAGFIGSCVDVDDRRRAQAAREEHDQQELALARQFEQWILAIVSHDIRNPLGAIAMSSEVLKSHPDRDARIDDIANRIGRSAARIASIVGDLLDISLARREGAIPIVLGNAELTSICREVIEEIAASSRRAIELHADETVTGRWDANRLTQAVSNLVGNALKHGTSGEPVRVRVEDAGDRAMIEVHNGGVIPEDVVATLFQPFATRSEQKRNREGLGLGLFIARSIARAHGGDLEFSSSSAAGTTFRIVLPRADAAA